MQVEIIKWCINTLGMFPQLHTPQMPRLGVVFISPTEKVAVGVEFPRNCY